MEPWIAITLLAAGLQNTRSSLQKKLTTRLDATEASYVRFCFALPFALAYVWILVAAGHDLPALNERFLAFAFAGSMAQIAGTVGLIRSFSYRNFAVGTAYSKTETVQTVLFSLIVLGEGVSWAPSRALESAWRAYSCCRPGHRGPWPGCNGRHGSVRAAGSAWARDSPFPQCATARHRCRSTATTSLQRP